MWASLFEMNPFIEKCVDVCLSLYREPVSINKSKFNIGQVVDMVAAIPWM